jgi:hypothetical protein
MTIFLPGSARQGRVLVRVMESRCIIYPLSAAPAAQNVFDFLDEDF